MTDTQVAPASPANSSPEARPAAVPGAVLAQEIASQPDMVAGFLDRQAANVEAICAALPPFSYLVAAARGSSDHACEYGRYLWSALWGTPVASATPSLITRYGTAANLSHALVVGVSQSGQSPDIVAVVKAAREQGRPTIAISNHGDSPLAEAAQHLIELGVGREKSIAATKTYTAQLAAVALLAASRLPDEKRARALSALREVPIAMRATLNAAAPAAAELATRWADKKLCLVLARGYNLGTAHEIALKLRELLRIGAQPFSVADFRHGSIALVGPGTACLVVAPNDETRADVAALVPVLNAMGAEVAVIGEQPVEGATHLPMVAGKDCVFSPLCAVLPGQLLALELAKQMKIDADNPVNLPEKVVKTL